MTTNTKKYYVVVVNGEEDARQYDNPGSAISRARAIAFRRSGVVSVIRCENGYRTWIWPRQADTTQDIVDMAVLEQIYPDE